MDKCKKDLGYRIENLIIKNEVKKRRLVEKIIKYKKERDRNVNPFYLVLLLEEIIKMAQKIYVKKRYPKWHKD